MTAPDRGPDRGPGRGPGRDLQLRPAGPGDAERLATLLAASGESLVGAGHQEVWVAEIPDDASQRVVGLVDLHRSWVALLVVEAGARRRGVGRALMELVQGLRPAGFELRVRAENARARAFYRALGLVELERTDGSDQADARPDVRLAWPGHDPLGFYRAALEDVETDLAVLRARRAALVSAVADLGADQRDPDNGSGCTSGRG